MRAYLRVKVKSLAAEATIIRREERRAKGDLRAGLHNHRVVIVRREARASQLALAFLRGVPITVLEGNSKTKPQWDVVERLVRTYGEGDMRDWMQRYSAWRAAHPLAA